MEKSEAYRRSSPMNRKESPQRPRTDANLEKVLFRDGRPEDLAFIQESAKQWQLDDEHLRAAQFLIAEETGNGIVGFGRIKGYESCYELGTVGVRPQWRAKGLGATIVSRLIARFPSDEVWITTDLVSYFEHLGFRVVETGPKELMEKISSTCRVKGRRGCKIMLLNRAPSSYDSSSRPDRRSKPRMTESKFVSRFGWNDDGGLGERLIQQILRGAKTATAAPKIFYSPEELKELYASVGQLVTVMDKDDRSRCTIKQIDVFETTYGRPDPRLVAGEGCADAGQFQRAHEHVWDDLFQKARSSLQDDTILIAEVFELITKS